MRKKDKKPRKGKRIFMTPAQRLACVLVALLPGCGVEVEPDQIVDCPRREAQSRALVECVRAGTPQQAEDPDSDDLAWRCGVTVERIWCDRKRAYRWVGGWDWLGPSVDCAWAKSHEELVACGKRRP
jgi:hypothetical protein